MAHCSYNGPIGSVKPKSKIKLLPCHCGSIPMVEPWHGGGPLKVVIGCDNDRCYDSPSVTGETLHTAQRKWNSRFKPKT